ncbi:zinc finger SWIM domain-containing protein 7 isoform X3 [Oncorhynchus kisutch]|uniref:zinc finger SWIM domain-containing protein 7 isoform X3 n=1 Tax=Oncorhynchus kisutch TaxID=8019 RepID=UPI0012DEDC78|nr:zinc finger SWIM domain-containing protein 7 isoform X3 [Oncorhynchus kisutch]
MTCLLLGWRCRHPDSRALPSWLAEVCVWLLCPPGLGPGGPALCHLCLIPQWTESISGDWRVRAAVHLLHLLSLLLLPSLRLHCAQEEREPAVQAHPGCLPQSGHGAVPAGGPV